MSASTGGRLVYAIGDVHGYRAQLAALTGKIARDAEAAGVAERPLLILLGDYVDRGPDSPGVVDLILDLAAAGRFEVEPLKGNHEDALLRFLDEPEFGGIWLANGADATLRAYGVDPADTGDWRALRDAFQRALPPAHLAFYRRLRAMRVVGDYAFVHAGVRPGLPLKAQSADDLLWIRYDFLDHPGPFEKVIVHGHTPTVEPQLLAHRLGIDTGVYMRGTLTAVRLLDADRRLIQAHGPA